MWNKLLTRNETTLSEQSEGACPALLDPPVKTSFNLGDLHQANPLFLRIREIAWHGELH